MASKITEKDIFKDLDFDNLKRGDIISHKIIGNSYVITDVNTKDKTATGVKIISISNESEWHVLKQGNNE